MNDRGLARPTKTHEKKRPKHERALRVCVFVNSPKVLISVVHKAQVPANKIQAMSRKTLSYWDGDMTPGCS